MLLSRCGVKPLRGCDTSIYNVRRTLYGPKRGCLVFALRGNESERANNLKSFNRIIRNNFPLNIPFIAKTLTQHFLSCLFVVCAQYSFFVFFFSLFSFEPLLLQIIRINYSFYITFRLFFLCYFWHIYKT